MPDNFRIYPNACIWTKDGINERLPVVTNGLVAHYPFDGRSGAFDMVGGGQTKQHVETGVNLIEAMNIDWKKPSSWSSNTGMSWDESKQALKVVGYHNSWLNIPILVDTTKYYQVSIDVMQEVYPTHGTGNGYIYVGGLMNNAAGQRVTTNYDYSIASAFQPALNVWTTLRATKFGTAATANGTSTSFSTTRGWTGDNVNVTDKLCKYYYFGGLWNYSAGAGVMYIKNISIVVTNTDTSNCTPTRDGIMVEEGTTNMIPGGVTNSYPTKGNTWSTYNTNQYNNNTYFSIGTIASVTNNIVTLATVGNPIYTYDVLTPQTTGGGLTAGTNYFIKKLSANTFSIHAYDSSQDGSKGFAVHDSIKNDVRVPINATNFPTMWWGPPHLPNSSLVKEIIPNGFQLGERVHDCIRLHAWHKPEGTQDGMAYGVYPTAVAGTVYSCSFWCRAANPQSIGASINLELWTSGGWNGDQVNKVITSMDWEYYSFTVTAPAAGAVNMYFWPSKGSTIDISEIQMEQKAYPTSYTTGTRAKGVLSIPNPFTGSAGSLNVRAKMTNGDSYSVAYKSLFSNVWSTNAFMIFINQADGLLYGHYPNTSASHSFFSFAHYPAFNEEVNVTLTWNGSNVKWYLNGGLKGTASDCDGARIASSITEFYVGCHPSYNCFGLVESVSAYNRQLTDAEVLQLGGAPINIKTTGPATVRSITEGKVEFAAHKSNGLQVRELVEDSDGWRLVYYGLTTNFDNTNSTNEVYYQAHGNDITFTQMRIKCPYWDYEVTATTNKTARMQLSFRGYVDWLYAQGDGTSPQIKFHGTDGVQDVVFTAPNTLLFGYGNDWRRITPLHYIAGGSTYLGAAASDGRVATTSWGPNYANNYPSYTDMRNDTIRETGRYRLTPKEYSTIQVWVK